MYAMHQYTLFAYVRVCVSARMSRTMCILVIRVDESWVKTQRPTVVLVSYDRPLYGLSEQDMGELESLLWNLTAFCL